MHEACACKGQAFVVAANHLEDTVAGGNGEDMTLVCLSPGWGNQRLVTPSPVLET